MTRARWEPIHRVRRFAAPAAGVDFSMRPDTASTWLIRAVRCQLVADANVATRTLFVAVAEDQDEWWRAEAVASHTAGQDFIYVASQGNGFPGVGVTMKDVPMPGDGIWILPGHTLTIGVNNIQAGDQISAVTMRIFEFPTGPECEVLPFVPTYMDSGAGKG